MRIKSTAIRRSARGQACTLRLPGICNGDPETTVLAHMPFGGRGMGIKASDLHAAYACSSCHDAIDGRSSPIDRCTVYECALRGLGETLATLTDLGLVACK